MRKLPVYFVVDISESMVGAPIEAVGKGIRDILAELRRDPYALETVYVSIISFAGKAQKLVPLTELTKIILPTNFPIGSGTSLGAGLESLMRSLDSEIVRPGPEQKGDWKPIVFLMTDGQPTDNYEQRLREWESKYKGRFPSVAISLGEGADAHLLGRFADHVYVMDDREKQSYMSLFKWVTASIKSTSQSVMERNLALDRIAEPQDPSIKKIDLSKTTPNKGIDDRFALLLGRCQKKKNHYLIKYQNGKGGYNLVGAYPVDASYFELSGQGQGELPSVATQNLIGQPTCPCCEQGGAMCQCSCGKLHCGHDGENTCPWCGATGTYSVGEFSVERGLG